MVLPQKDHLGEVFQVDLVDDPQTRRYDPKVIKSLLSPSQELIPLTIAREFNVDIQLQCITGCKMIHLH